MMNAKVEIIDYHPRYTEQTIAMWRKSKEQALGMPEAHDVAQHRYFLNRILTATHSVYLAIDKYTRRVIGMIAFDDNVISQLYVEPDYQHRGIGTALVEFAKATTHQDLHLYTFAMNQGARAFWKKQGFVEKTSGPHQNEQGLGDILCEWQREESLPMRRYAIR